MRLISMSTHAQLKNNEQPIRLYSRMLDTIVAKVRSYNQSWDNPIVYPKPSSDQRELIVLVSSQKGLCGSFNNHLFTYFENNRLSNSLAVDIIVIGQKGCDFIKNRSDLGTVLHAYEKFSYARLMTITQKICHTIIHQEKPYAKVTIFSNTFKSFFLQKPQRSVLIPFESHTHEESSNLDDMLWEQTPKDLLDTLIHQYLEARIQQILYTSLVSEHAARFISMDNATRNAETLLETTQLDYNKLRQAKITKRADRTRQLL